MLFVKVHFTFLDMVLENPSEEMMFVIAPESTDTGELMILLGDTESDAVNKIVPLDVNPK